jgi:hypothetical protein
MSEAVAIAAPWAFPTLTVLSAVWFTVQYSDRKEKTDAVPKSPEFKKFQRNYLGIYLVIQLADWLQGTNMWTLYNVRADSLHLPKTPCYSLGFTLRPEFYDRVMPKRTPASTSALFSSRGSPRPPCAACSSVPTLTNLDARKHVCSIASSRCKRHLNHPAWRHSAR